MFPEVRTISVRTIFGDVWGFGVLSGECTPEDDRMVFGQDAWGDVLPNKRKQSEKHEEQKEIQDDGEDCSVYPCVCVCSGVSRDRRPPDEPRKNQE